MENRLCRWLLGARQRSGRTDLPITQTILVQMPGVQRTTVTREPGKLQEVRALTCRRGHIHLLDPEQIARHACECEDEAVRPWPRPWAHALSARGVAHGRRSGAVITASRTSGPAEGRTRWCDDRQRDQLQCE